MTLAAWCGHTNVVVELVKAGTKLDLQNKVQNYISRLLPHETYNDYNSTLDIKSVSVQQQKGRKDCGVFAVAYAVEVCLGRNPQYSVFDQTKMRPHLYKCLSQGVLKPFPRSTSESLLNNGHTDS